MRGNGLVVSHFICRGDGTYIIGRQRIEQPNDLLEEIHDLLLRLIVREAIGLERTVAGAVLVPLMLPKGLVGATLVLPVLLHVGQSTLTNRSSGFENARDVVMLTLVIAVLSVGAVTKVWPKTVDGPVVSRASGWLGVPELYLQDLTLNLGATSVLDDSGVLATQGRVKRADRWKCEGSFGKP